MEGDTVQAPTGKQAFGSAFLPYHPRAAPPGLKLQGESGTGAYTDTAQAGGGGPHYLYAVQLLGQDAEKVFREVAQKWGVPVPVAALAGRGHGAQHIDAAGRQVRMRREQSGPHMGVQAHHTRILLRMAPMCPSFPPPPALAEPSPLGLDAYCASHCFQPPNICKVSGPRGFPGGPGAKTSPSNARGAGSIPRQGGKMLHVSWPNKQTKGLWA